jgi:hypothetical protein
MSTIFAGLTCVPTVGNPNGYERASPEILERIEVCSTAYFLAD